MEVFMPIFLNNALFALILCNIVKYFRGVLLIKNVMK